MIKKKTTYYRDRQLVETELSGNLNATDVDEWHQSLRAVLSDLPSNTKFKILVNLHGFKAENFEVHKKFRGIVPTTLAGYGWYVGYLRMFPEAEISISSKENIYCVAAAHVHHDDTKIQNYQSNYSMKNEAFFTDATQAREWIDSVEIA